MKKLYCFTCLLLLPLQIFAAYTPVGSDSTIDVLSWNIENFPKSGSATIDEVAAIVKDLDADMIAVQEIASVSAFNDLLGQLPGWDGILSSHEYSPGEYQKVGLLFNEQITTVHSHQLLFEGDSYAFPRPPMEFTLTCSEGDNTFDLKLITLHLKAFSGEDNEARRRAAVESLKVYIDDQVQAGQEQDFILLGDFNDHLEDPVQDNVFTVMLDDTADYTFLSEPLAGVQGSYIGYNEPNLIDHICITSDARVEYGEQGQTEVLYLDNQNSSYESTVSDHRPVFARFMFSNENPKVYTPLAEIQQNFNEFQGQLVTVKGVVTIGAGLFSSEFTSVYIQDSSDCGINIYKSGSVIEDFTLGSEVEVRGEVADYNGLHELVYQGHSVLNTVQPLPDAFEISSDLINDTNAQPGRWVKVSGEIESISAGPHINIIINDGSGSGTLYFDPDAGLDVTDFAVGETIEVNGVKTVYNHEGQVQPGYQQDIKKIDPSGIRTTALVPEKAALTGNFPNPFNPVTIIKYFLPEAARVRISVYSLDGRKIAASENLIQVAGEHALKWTFGDPENLAAASGIYIYRLEVNGQFIDARRMLYLK